jgi:hypothetical protein
MSDGVALWCSFAPSLVHSFAHFNWTCAAIDWDGHRQWGPADRGSTQWVVGLGGDLQRRHPKAPDRTCGGKDKVFAVHSLRYSLFLSCLALRGFFSCSDLFSTASSLAPISSVQRSCGMSCCRIVLLFASLLCLFTCLLVIGLELTIDGRSIDRSTIWTVVDVADRDALDGIAQFLIDAAGVVGVYRTCC